MISKEILDECKNTIEVADYILIGAGAGLSTAAGLLYSGQRFTHNFPDFIEHYGLTDMYSAMFYSFPSPEERWAYVSRHTKMNGFDPVNSRTYSDLLRLTANRDYFVLTTNGDDLFFREGFESDRIFASQGSYRFFQCAKPCNDKLYGNKKMVFDMVKEQKNCRIPSKMIPVCPNCGGPLIPHLRVDNHFVENEDWHNNAKRCSNFIKKSYNGKLVMIELGVGFNTPGIIRWPFEQITETHPDAKLIRVNATNVENRFDVNSKSILIQGDISEFLQMLNKNHPV